MTSVLNIHSWHFYIVRSVRRRCKDKPWVEGVCLMRLIHERKQYLQRLVIQLSCRGSGMCV